MKSIFNILFLVVGVVLSAQNTDSLGINDLYTVNYYEADYLNRSIGKLPAGFDFQEKKVIFTKGNGAKIITKSDYFQKLVIPLLLKNTDMVNYLVVLSDQEKIDSGGFDAIVVAWSKIGLTNKRKKSIIRKYGKTK